LFKDFKHGIKTREAYAPGGDPGIFKGESMDLMQNTRLPNLKTKPIHEVRLGQIKAAVWRNETEAGVRFNATFSRLYKDGDQWKSTESCGRDDLLLLGKVADQTHSWICSQAQENEDKGSSAARQGRVLSSCP